LGEAIACYRRAVAADPKLALAHNGLGNALKAKGELGEAIACYRRAVAADPKLALAHNGLGNALREKGELAEAIACFRRAIAADPKLAPAHYNLGLVLYGKGDVAGAIACWRQAIAADPKLAPAHYNLGVALHGKGDVAGAIACFRSALALRPDFAEAHCNLGLVLQQQGQFAAALRALRRGHQLGSRRPRWPSPSASWVRHCERLVDLEARLPALLAGKLRPKDAAERLDVALLCSHPSKGLPATAVRFYEEAFTDQPARADDLGAGHRYNAACAAALAAAGKGKDSGKLTATQRARLRQQALGWLRADLKARAKQLNSWWPGAPAQARQALTHWRKDPDLASLRDKALDALPELERAAWRKLWAEVDDLLKGHGAGMR
jgi:tetratricopeptide (TPR) repeat protein